MGRGKRNPSNRPSPIAIKSADAPAANGDLKSVPPPTAADLKAECDRALTAIRRGNHTKALRLMKDASSRFESFPIFHRVHGTVAVKVASILDDPAAKLRHLRLALDSSRRAAALSPSSIEFAHFHASLLYEAATEARGYEEVVHECERALAVEDPIDPAREVLHDEAPTPRLATAEARIAHMHGELRSLIQKANIASISSWMKTLGGNTTIPGEEKFRLIPMRRLTEDPMEVCIVPAAPRRPNEIKKATKTPEERRQEIEVRVAAARIIQQNSGADSVNSISEEGTDSPNTSPTLSSSSAAQRLAERRKLNNSRKLTSSVDRMDQVRSYWNSMSAEQKQAFLAVSIADLRAYYAPSPKDSLASDVLSEALSFVADHEAWEFWSCCRCGEKFTDSNSHTHHIVQEHMETLSPKLQSVLPQEVDGQWVEMLVNGSWKPIDVDAAMYLLGEEQLKFQSVIKDDDSEIGSKDKDSLSEYWSPKGNSSDSSPSPQKRESEDGVTCNGFAMESRNNDGVSNFEYVSRKWPLSDDMERAKLLERIQNIFQSLVKHKSLSVSHLNKVIQFAMDEIQSSPFSAILLTHALDQSPLCICFLGTPQLRKVFNFLQELWQSCGVGRYSEKDTITGDVNGAGQVNELVEGVTFEHGSSSLLLDGRVFGGKSGSSIDEVADNLPNANAIVSWLFSGPTSTDQLSAWIRMRDERSQQGLEILQNLEKEFYLLQSMCERKSEHLSYDEALQAVESLCVEELKRREHATKSTTQSYEAVLRKRQEELMERDNEPLFISSRFELDAVSNVLKEAQTLKVPHFGYDETLSGVTSRFCELENIEDDEWRVNDCFQQADSCIELAMQRQKDQLLVELNKIDARIMRNVTGMQQLELKLGPISAFDYRKVILPLVKSFLRMHLEDLVDKDATEKSDAAREAFLAELARDSKKTINKDGELKQMHEKSKDKKKNKDRKIKDVKVAGCNDPLISHQETIEQSKMPANGNLTESEPISSDDYLKQEEFRRKVELEAEERKLEETLEYQRRIEDEAKQKHLAELLKSGTGNSPDNFGDETYVTGSGLSADYLGPRDMLSYYSQTTLRDNTSPDIITNGITFGDFHFSEPVMRKNHESMEFDRPKVAFARQHLAQNVEKQQLVDIPMDTAHEPRTVEVQPVGQTIRMANSSPGIQVNGVKRIEASPKSSSGSLSKKKRSNSQSHSKKMQGDDSSKTLHESRAGDDEEEERFREDLKKAVLNSLDDLEAHKNASITPVSRLYQDLDVSDALSNGHAIISSGKDVFGTGLKNAVGEYNCFLNVIIQSLWHLRRFRDEFLRASVMHSHVGNPCVICALYDIFIALSKATEDSQGEAVSPTSLRIALSNLYPDSNFFQEAQMNDASEVLAVIFECLHLSFTFSGDCDTESDGSNCGGTWDCSSATCIAHTFFGMNIFERMNCYICSLESRHMKYTSFFHNVNANALRTMKMTYADSSFDEILKMVEMNHQLACDAEAGGCGKPNYIHHILSSAPHVFTIVLGWQNMNESVEDISATLAAITTEVDIRVFYRGLDQGSKYSLISLVCYYGQHYHCFAFEDDRWVMYDDQTVKVVGDWNDVLSSCEKGHLQPQVLFFEATS